MLPLYKHIGLPCNDSSGHQGLWFDRFFDGYDPQWDVKDIKKQGWINTVIGNCGLHSTLHSHAIAQAMLCKHLEGHYHVAKSTWHTVIGMGNNHPVENGFSWHPTLGTPYLTGAAVKGLVRAWLEEWSDLEENELKEKCHRWFGSEDKDPNKQVKENQTGLLIFFDALPVIPVTLKSDIMTPHMGNWYQQGKEIGRMNASDYNNTLPADWHNPIPVPFLVSKQASFLFCIAPRNNTLEENELEEAIQILDMALEYLGVGAKTAAGYGRFEVDSEEQKRLEKAIKQEEIKSMKPEEAFRAFLNDEDTEDKHIARMFARDYNRTLIEFDAKEVNWKPILMEEKSELIRSWHNSPNISENNAYGHLREDIPKPVNVAVVSNNQQVSNYNLNHKIDSEDSVAMDLEIYKQMDIEYLLLLGKADHNWFDMLEPLEKVDETLEDALLMLMEIEGNGSVQQALLTPFQQPLSDLLSIPCEIFVIDSEQEAQQILQQKVPKQNKNLQKMISQHFK